MASVLVIDDEPAISMLLKVFLTTEGYWVRTAANGKQGMEILEHGSKPDLILLDLCMPVMPGRNFIQEMRDRREWRDIPVIVLTASAPDSAVMPPPGSYNFLLHKPFDLDELLGQVRRCLADGIALKAAASS